MTTCFYAPTDATGTAFTQKICAGGLTVTNNADSVALATDASLSTLNDSLSTLSGVTDIMWILVAGILVFCK
eukprot:567036-Amorphochlora_amoeboformis.AAC.2